MKRGHFSMIEVLILLLEMLSSEQFTYVWEENKNKEKK